MAELVQYYGTGRRKTAIARVYLRPGSGDFKVNGRAFEEYFVTPAQRSAARMLCRDLYCRWLPLAPAAAFRTWL